MTGLPERDELRRLAEAATAGPWFREYGDVVTSGDDPRDVAEGYDDPRAERIIRRAPHRELRDPQAIADAAFIAAARNHLIPLLDALDTAEQDNKRLREMWDRENGFQVEASKRAYTAEAERDRLAGQLAAVEKRHAKMRSALSCLHVWNDDVSGKRMVYADDLLAALEADAALAAAPEEQT